MPSSSLYHKYYGSDLTRRQQNDFYETPAVATEALLERVLFRGSIIDPACGKGAIVRVLRRHYPKRLILYSDLVNYHFLGQRVQDFLAMDWQVQNVITNAPYSLAIPFVYHAVKCAEEKVAMLFRLDFLQSRSRKRIFQETGLTDVFVFSYRIKFIIDGSARGMVPYAWYLWDKTNPLKKNQPYRLWII